MSRFVRNGIKGNGKTSNDTASEDLEEKMRLIANLIIDRILEDKNNETMLKLN